MAEFYAYCPYCGSRLGPYHDHQRSCPSCHATIYENLAACAGILLLNDHDQVLLIKRAFAPFKGAYGMTGGFCEPGESALQTALREVEEETGLTDIEVLDFIGTFPDRYGARGAYTQIIMYVGRLRAGEPKPNAEVAGLEWHDIDAIPKAAFTAGFANTRDALKALQKWCRAHS